jgi:hypothetical protein
MTYAVHEDFLAKRIAEAEELGKSFGKGSAYQDLLAILRQYEARHLEMLRDRNRMLEAAHQEGIRIGERRVTAKIVSLLRVEGPIAGGVIWQTIARIARDIERGDHIEHTAAQGGDENK